jgi:hypothetical protein
MTEEQEQHLGEIQDQFCDLVDAKYRKGAREHASQLNKDYTAKELLDMAIDEAIDQVTYLLTLREKL